MLTMLGEPNRVCSGVSRRSPSANKEWGRGHWSTLFPAVLAGAGIRGGTVNGETDKHAGYAVSPPIHPEDLVATIYHALGIDPETRVLDAQGRPHAVVAGGRAMVDWWG